jgi:hypothetical protein
VQAHRTNLHDRAALIVKPPGVPGERFLVLDPQAGLQGDLFARPALAQKPHLADLCGKHRAAILWVHGQHVETDQLHKGLEQVGRVLVAGGGQMREIIGLTVNGFPPYQSRTGTVDDLQHTIPAVESGAVFVPFEHLFMIHGLSPQLIGTDRKILESLGEFSTPATEEHLSRAVRDEAVGPPARGGDLFYG